jgi:hypothetical protein
VVNRDKIRKYVSTKDVKDLFQIINAFCLHADIETKAVSNIRAPKDLYLLSLAETI